MLTLAVVFFALLPVMPAEGSQVLAFSGDGTSVVTQVHQDLTTGGYSNQFEVWQVATGKSVFRPAVLLNQSAWEAAFSPNGRYLVVGMYGQQPDDLSTNPGNKKGEWILWDVWQKRVVRQSIVPYGWVTGVAFSPDGTQFAIASVTRDPSDNDNGAKVFMVESQTAKTLRTYRTGLSTTTSLTFSPDGQTLGVCGAVRPPRDGQTPNIGVAQLWDAYSPVARQSLQIPNCDLIGLTFSGQGEILACRYIMRNPVLQNALTAEFLFRVHNSEENVSPPDEATLKAARFEKTNDVLGWNPRTGQTTRWPGSTETAEVSTSFNHSQLRFSSEARTLSGVMHQNTPDPNHPRGSGYVETRWAIRTWKTESLSFNSAFSTLPITTTVLENSRLVDGDPILSPDGSKLAGIDIGNNIHFWDSRTARIIGTSWKILP